MDDKTYIALLEKIAEDRKAYINDLICICKELVKEKEELNKALVETADRFDDLIFDYGALEHEYLILKEDALYLNSIIDGCPRTTSHAVGNIANETEVSFRHIWNGKLWA